MYKYVHTNPLNSLLEWKIPCLIDAANKFANLAFTRSLLNLPATSTYSLQISLAPIPSIFKWTKPGKDASSSTRTLESNSCSGFELDNASIRKRYSNLSRWGEEGRERKEIRTIRKIQIPFWHFYNFSTSYYYEWFTFSNFYFHCFYLPLFVVARSTKRGTWTRILDRDRSRPASNVGPIFPRWLRSQRH